MFKWIGTTLVAASLFAVIGCNGSGVEDEPAGGPGADVRSDQDQEPQQEQKTFTPSLDQENLELPAGQEKEVTLSIERGDQFDQTVTVEIQPPQGITAEPTSLELQSGQTEGKITFRAASGAAVGEEQAVELTFQPETGESVTKQLTVTVTEAQQSDGGQQDSGSQQDSGESGQGGNE